MRKSVGAARLCGCGLASVGVDADGSHCGSPFPDRRPEPVDYQHYEFYTFSMGTAVKGDTSGIGPAWEFNYGIIPNGQLHIIAPMAFDSMAGGPAQFGYGETELGFKYRFIQEDKDGVTPMVGISCISKSRPAIKPTTLVMAT